MWHTNFEASICTYRYIVDTTQSIINEENSQTARLQRASISDGRSALLPILISPTFISAGGMAGSQV